MGSPQSKQRKRRAQRPNKEQDKLSRSALKKQIKAKAKLEKVLAETKAKGDAELRALALAVAGLGGVQLPAITSEQTTEQTHTTTEQTPNSEHTSTEEIPKEEKMMKSTKEMMTTDDSVTSAISTDAVAKVINNDAVSKSEDLNAIQGINQSTLAAKSPISSTSIKPRPTIASDTDVCVGNTVDEPPTTTPPKKFQIPSTVITDFEDEVNLKLSPENVTEGTGSKEEDNKDVDDEVSVDDRGVDDEEVDSKEANDKEMKDKGMDDKEANDKGEDGKEDDIAADKDSSTSLEQEAPHNPVKAVEVLTSLDKHVEKVCQSEVLDSATDEASHQYQTHAVSQAQVCVAVY
ncbi:uncharacterized protein LOC110985994 isoform X2 [Acanthaster planci]|uniref:Uncharacterized protein LOC110985994 isoform X2 n=1 Tax=Acanthaster planci TaxID=133434 RepID=A0A8B7ZE28_ACAPL|nr:uncharacterized protein LOC110985994 isoform X2 [Acanthaster planci]